MRRLFIFAAFLLASVPAFGQASAYHDIVLSGSGQPLAGATITVCLSTGTGTPCGPTVTLYGDAAETPSKEILNPTATDGLGNVSFWVPSTVNSGNYQLCVSGGPVVPYCYYFSVGGGGQPTVLSTDNIFTSNNRFKGPIPYRDITAYMPEGGCDNSSVTNRMVGYITSGTTALTTTYNAGTISNGCGVFVAGAGPTSTLATPAQGSAPNPNIVGTVGSSTVHYKVAAIDGNFGTSAASAAITVTTAPSTRTPLNYVGIYWTSVANAVGYLIYTDQNGGGTYVPLGYSFACYSFTAGYTCGAIDKGAETNTWTGFSGFWPTAPPATATNQALITTIAAGAGTTSLTLATAATNTASGVFVEWDNSPFIKQAISDASTDGSPSIANKGTVFIPEGNWWFSSIPFPSTGIAGIKIVQAGSVELYGLPVEGSIPGTGNSGNVSWTGTGGLYGGEDFLLSCSNISGYQSLGALFVVGGSPGGLNLDNLWLTTSQGGIVQDSLGEITSHDLNLTVQGGTGIGLQIDNNTYFSIFDNTNWNDSANNTGNNIPIIWFLGLTNSGHDSGFAFKNNTFVSHTVRYDNPFPLGGGPVGAGFLGFTSVENNWDLGFINQVSGYSMDIVADNIGTGDINAPSQSIFYSYNGLTNAGVQSFIHGGIEGFSKFADSAIPGGGNTVCRSDLMDNPNQGGSGVDSVGYWGNQFGVYDECDLGMTRTGNDVQTTEVLTGGGNDPYGPAGEQMIGHVFRRPVTTTTAGSGSLAAGTYYIKVTVVDVAGRESAPSREVSQAVGASGSVGVTSVGGTYFPASCNVYFGTTAGGEANYFNTTAIANGTCTYTLTTTSGATAKAPQAVGNAMNTWLTEENNANSCLYCGSSNGGTGSLGIGLNATQYANMPSGSVSVGVPMECTSVNVIRCVSPSNPQGWAGSDVGAWLNAAMNGFCGEVNVAAGTYTQTTQITKPRCVEIWSSGPGAELIWAGSATGTALAIGDTAGAGNYPAGGVFDIYFYGSGTTNATNCIFMGGDPAAAITPSTAYADEQSIERVRCTNFGTGVSWGNNAYDSTWIADHIEGNNLGLYAQTGITNSGEGNKFISGTISGNATGAFDQVGAVDWNFTSTEFDFDNNGASTGGPSTTAAFRGSANFINCHFELWNGPFFGNASIGTAITIIGGQMVYDSTAAIVDTAMIVQGQPYSSLHVAGLNIYSNHTVTEFIDWTATAPEDLHVDNLMGNGNADIGLVTNALTPFESEFVYPGIAFPTVPLAIGSQIDINGVQAATVSPVPLTVGSGTGNVLAQPYGEFVCTAACTVTPPVPVAGYKFCVENSTNVATVITLGAIGSGAMYGNTAWTAYGTAGTGTVTSGGAVGDRICLTGLDSTHYIVSVFYGTWTVH